MTLTWSQNFFFGFASLITAAAAWSIWGGDMFPQPEDPKGDPQNWTEEQMRQWLKNVGHSDSTRFVAVVVC